MKNRIISAFLVMSIVFTLLPVRAFAASSVGATEPTLTALTVQDKDGKTISLLDRSGTATVMLGETYTFKAVFSNIDKVQSVYITSTKGNEKAILEASYDQNEHAFISTGFFNDDNEYVPGKIGVEYAKKTNDVRVGSSVDWSVLQSALDEQCTVTVDSTSDEAIQAAVDISKLLNDETKVVVNVAIDVFDAKTGGNLDEWLGYYHDLEAMQKRVLEGGKYYLYLDDTSMETYIAMVVRDVSESRYTKIVLKEAEEYTKSLKEVAENLETVNLISGIVYDFFDIHNSVKDLRQEISQSSFILESQKAELYVKVDEYETDRRSFSLLTALLPVVVGATGGTMAGPAIVFTALLGAINAASGTFWNYRVGMIQGCEPIDVTFASNAHGIPLTDEYLRANHNKITASGTYYLTKNTYADDFGRSFSIGDSDSGTSIDVTLCLHGYSCSANLAGDGSTLKICDCTYREDADGTVVGGSASIKGFYNDQTIFVESGTVGEIQMWAENTGTVIVNGGVVTYINMNHVDSNGRVIINGGTIGLGILAYGDESEIIINNGLVLAPVSSGQFSRAHIRTDSGNIKIYGGQIFTSIEVGTGTLNIYDGIIDSLLENEGGTINISGGIVRNRIKNYAGILNVDGGEIASIHNEDDGMVNITDGVIFTADIPAVAHCLPIENYGGTIVITGGIIIHGQGQEMSVRNSGETTISNGLFQGYIYNEKNGKITLLINKNSNIEVTRSFVINNAEAPIVQATTNYTGGVTYYNAIDAIGHKMTIEEATKIDYTALSYVRLVADGASDGSGTGSNPEGCEHTYTSIVTAPTCTEQGYTTYTCSKCGHVYKDNSTNALGHTYGDWVITTAATSTSNGQRERICSRCNNKETEIIPATGGGPSSGGSSGGSSSGGSSSDMNYSINTPSRITGGTIHISSSSVRKGNTVTITVTPNTGFELDKLTVTDNKGNNLKLTDEGNGKFAFTMPASKVNVDAVFVKIEETPTQPSISFTDVSADAYYADAVAWAVDRGITVGTTDTNFSPNAPCTRAQIVTFLWRAAGSPIIGGNNPFTDVVSGSYYYDAVRWAVAQGITAGTDEMTFSPNATCTRAQAVTFLYRYEKAPAVRGGNTFIDIGANAYYADAVQWAVAQGITVGTGETTFGPNETCTRAQIVTFLYRDRVN